MSVNGMSIWQLSIFNATYVKIQIETSIDHCRINTSKIYGVTVTFTIAVVQQQISPPPPSPE
jgi:hypothetical protein